MHPVNEKIINLLRDNKITQKAVAKKIGIKPPTLHRKLNQDKPLIASEIEIIAGLLKMKAEEIYNTESRDLPPVDENPIDEQHYPLMTPNEFQEYRYGEIIRRLELCEMMLSKILHKLENNKKH